MLLGALLLIRSPLTGAGVSLGVAVGVTAPAAALTIVLMRLVLGSRAWQPATGKERLVGAAAEVTEPLAPVAEGPEGSFAGMVRVNGELWRARAPQPIPAGERVRVVGVRGLTVDVAPVGESAALQP